MEKQYEDQVVSVEDDAADQPAPSEPLSTPSVVRLGNFTKTLGHDAFGEVLPADSSALNIARAKRRDHPTNPADVNTFNAIPWGSAVLPVPAGFRPAPYTNPLAGLARDPLVPAPDTFSMPPPPSVISRGTAAEMTELYWMALLRDVPFDQSGFANADFVEAAKELDSVFSVAKTAGTLIAGVDLPCAPITAANVFRIGLPGDDVGPMLSQFWLRDARYGTQRIDQMQDPYRRGLDFMTTFDEWLHAQNTGRGRDGSDYPRSNEFAPSLYLESPRRYISCMRDLARFVNKDALHQAYFTAALLLLDGQARWTPGNPYFDTTRRDAGFGTLGGPHLLALVSEVATRALQTVWFQKWQTWLRLRPEAYAGHLHVQEIGVGGTKKPYGLKATGSFGKKARDRIRANNNTLMLPMAFTAGSPTHPSYGAGHATVAGACVTILKAFFRLLDDDGVPLSISTLTNFPTFVSGIDASGAGTRTNIPFKEPTPPGREMTIEGELNKLASNVAMGRTMGGVHWRTDNTRSLALGEAMAVHVLAKIAVDLIEKPTFVFRTFGQTLDGSGSCAPKLVTVGPDPADPKKPRLEIAGQVYKLTDASGASLSDLLNPPSSFGP